jgi:hypothetical protein
MAKKDSKSTETKVEVSFINQLIEAGTINATTLAKALEDSYNIQVNINKSFGQGQERLTELMGSVSDAIPRVTRLGGQIADVEKTMIGISQASRRNVIANTEDVAKLYAASEILGESVEDMGNKFLDVGIGISQIPEELEKSINYIQSIGGNTEQVMKDVASNMDKMNRYQFEGGVAGLTKMAAQASMLRFDMQETFALADKVLDPENAIEVASAFQRLGVSAGNLVDPFQLMNMSINDPSGLQNSLAEVAKQFSYFDEETKSFKINPQGVLTLREMEKQAGLSTGSLSKMAVAAAELDKRLSDVDAAGLTFASEEDKQYLANIATLQDGKYMVTLEDDTKKELSQLNQEEFDKLIEEQKTGPKTLEEIAKSQLSIDEDLLANVRGIADTIKQGVTSPRQIRQGVAATQRITKTAFGEASDKLKVEDFRDFSGGIIQGLEDMTKEFISGNKSFTDVVTGGFNNFGSKLDVFGDKLKDTLKEVGENIAQKLTEKTSGEKFIKEKVGNFVESYGGKPTAANVSPISPQTNTNIQVAQTTTTTQINKGNVDVGGKIQIELMTPAGVNTEQLRQFADATFNSPQFKDYIMRTVSPNDLKEPVSKTYA